MRAFLKDIRRLGGGSGFEKRASELLLSTLAVNTVQLAQEMKEYLESLKTASGQT